jgi:hypothetical protein
MIILVTVGPLLALAFGLAIASDLRDRRSRRRRVQGGQINASKGDWLNTAPEYFGKGAGEYFPPPDNGRPGH